MNLVDVSPGELWGTIDAPPSKSYTHRSLVAGFLTGRSHRTIHPNDSEDTRATLAGLRTLGAEVHREEDAWTVSGEAAWLPGKGGTATVDCHSSGTTLRFLAPLAALEAKTVRFVGRPDLAARPTRALFDALVTAGARVERPGGPRTLPCSVSGPVHAGGYRLPADRSSQYLSALLFILPTLRGDSSVRVDGQWVSRPYLEATRAVLRAHRVRLPKLARRFEIEGGQEYRATRFRVTGDASSASYLWAAAAVTGGSVDVRGIDRDWPQADLAILAALEQMGASVRATARSVRVTGPLTRGAQLAVDDAPDLLPLLAVCAALLPEGRRVRLDGGAHARWKESDRRAGSVRLARRLGAAVRLSRDRVVITSGSHRPARLHLRSLPDHRMLMSAGVAALALSGISRLGPARAVSKSFPAFWQSLRVLGAAVRSGP